MNNKLMITYAKENIELQKQMNQLNQQNKLLIQQNEILNQELNFFQSVFKTHQNSVIFNLKQKFKNGEKIWIDPITCNHEEITELDQDDETIEWLKPVKCER